MVSFAKDVGIGTPRNVYSLKEGAVLAIYAMCQEHRGQSLHP